MNEKRVVPKVRAVGRGLGHSCGVGNAAPVGGDKCVEDEPSFAQSSEGPDLVGVHQVATTFHIRRENGDQSALSMDRLRQDTLPSQLICGRIPQ